MPLTPSIGIYLPGNGYVNGQSSPFASGTGDIVTGQSTYQGGGLTPGRIIELSDTEAAALAAPGSTLYGGYYQWVQMDPSASTLAQGQLMFWKDSTIAPGFYTVTNIESGNFPLIAGAMVNPAAYLPTAGNWFLMFIGPGRAQLLTKVTITNTSPAIGDSIFAAGAGAGASNATVDDYLSSATFAPAMFGKFIGVAETLPANNSLVTVEWLRNFVRA